ncbi:hypothetical protein GGX14DRAFT_395926 [Mycena pura]|uniref:Uncharacterized protein n=1 Tax=Mycena pura TaxID=153505 RepID=A0AAD6YG99_9AGAR|nr:hypothetical protein GGX14DRAFT_395926 [Mycena pura]
MTRITSRVRIPTQRRRHLRLSASPATSHAAMSNAASPPRFTTFPPIASPHRASTRTLASRELMARPPNISSIRAIPGLRNTNERQLPPCNPPRGGSDSRAAWVKKLLCYGGLRRREATAPSPSSQHLAPGLSRIAPHVAMRRLPVPHPAPPSACSPHGPVSNGRAAPFLRTHHAELVLHLSLAPHPCRAAAPPRTAHQSPRAGHRPLRPRSAKKKKKLRRADAGVPVLLGAVFSTQDEGRFVRGTTFRGRTSFPKNGWLRRARRSAMPNVGCRSQMTARQGGSTCMVYGGAPGVRHTARREAVDILTWAWTEVYSAYRLTAYGAGTQTNYSFVQHFNSDGELPSGK